jgi:hypothetical protein
LDLEIRKNTSMDGLNPALRLLLTVKTSMERGESVRQGLMKSLHRPAQPYTHSNTDEFSALVSAWFARHEQGISASTVRAKIKSPYRRNLLDLIERGLKGEPILQPLRNLEIEMIQACHEELERRILMLPMKALIPLLFLQFPALAILFLCPFLSRLSQL